MASHRGKQPSKNAPVPGTPADKRKKGRGEKPGPKPAAPVKKAAPKKGKK